MGAGNGADLGVPAGLPGIAIAAGIGGIFGASAAVINTYWIQEAALAALTYTRDIKPMLAVATQDCLKKLNAP